MPVRATPGEQAVTRRALLVHYSTLGRYSASHIEDFWNGNDLDIGR
jgi:hypothetical protein